MATDSAMKTKTMSPDTSFPDPQARPTAAALDEASVSPA